MKIQTKTIPLSDNEFGLVHKHLVNTETYFIAGSNSMYIPSQQTRYINDRVARTWPDVDGVPTLMTPGQAARTELQRAFPGHKRVGWRPGMVKLFDWRPPMHFTGAHHGQMTQIDLRGAYYQIYRLLWLNVPYPRGFGTLSLSPVADALMDWKAARNSVIGLCASRQAVGIKGVVRYTLRTRNAFLSPGLWATVQSILHAIAHVAITYGALYINTDGYIFPDSVDCDAFTAWLYDLGFAWEFKGMGEGHITGWNSYQVGDRSTQIYKLRMEVNTYEHTNVRTDETNPWIEYVKRVAKLTPRNGRP